MTIDELIDNLWTMRHAVGNVNVYSEIKDEERRSAVGNIHSLETDTFDDDEGPVVLLRGDVE
jgi:hypothetical protein